MRSMPSSSPGNVPEMPGAQESWGLSSCVYTGEAAWTFQWGLGGGWSRTKPGEWEEPAGAGGLSGAWGGTSRPRWCWAQKQAGHCTQCGGIPFPELWRPAEGSWQGVANQACLSECGWWSRLRATERGRQEQWRAWVKAMAVVPEAGDG